MEPDTVSTPKINKSTFSFGSGSLMKRVANNEKKITILKNIIQTNRSNIGEKITPKMSSLQESLMVTNEVLVDIARQLEEDFDSRVDEKKLLLQKSRWEKLEIRRQNFEERLETKKTEKTVATAARKTIKPLGNIFSKIFSLVKILGTGLLINAVVGNFDKIIGFFSGDTFKNIQTKLTQAYQLINKHMGLIVAVGAGLVALSLVGTIANIVSLGAGMLSILANPLFIAGVGIILAASMQGLGRGEKQTLDELEKMGGFTQENRNKLIEKLKEQKNNLTPLEILQGVGSEIDERIKFLETGEYGYGKDPKVFDFSSVEKMKSLNTLDKLRLTLDDDSLGGVEIQELPPIDMREQKKADRYLEPGGDTGTKVASVSSFNGMNNYMKETPSLFGFSDLVYT